jgi:hypothetical protein
MARFVVDLGDVAMSPDVEQMIAADLQKTVLGHLADMKPKNPMAFRIPEEWLGLILRQEIEGLIDAEAMLRKGLLAGGGMR